MRSMSLLVGSVFLFLSPLLSLGSSDRSHNGESESAVETDWLHYTLLAVNDGPTQVAPSNSTTR